MSYDYEDALGWVHTGADGVTRGWFDDGVMQASWSAPMQGQSAARQCGGYTYQLITIDPRIRYVRELLAGTLPTLGTRLFPELQP